MAKAVVPKLRFPEFRESPEWTARSIGGLCRIQTGKKDANEGAPEGIYPFFTCAEDHIFCNSYSFDAEAILIAGNANVGQAKYYNGKFEAYQRTYVLTDFASIHVPYLFAFLSANLRPALLAQVQTSAMSYIRLPMLEEFQVATPPSTSEQRKVADCLTSLDELIAAQGRKVEALKAYKHGLMQQLFPREGETVPRLRFPEFHDQWREVAIGEICISISSGKDLAVAGGDFDLYGSTGVIGKTDKATYIGEYLLIARVGANAGFLNKVSGSFGASDNTLVVDLRKEINLEFVGHYLDNFKLNKLSFGSGQPLITGGQIKALKIGTPSLREQFCIASVFTSFDDQIAAENRMCDNLKVQKQAIIQKLFPVLDER